MNISRQRLPSCSRVPRPHRAAFTRTDALVLAAVVSLLGATVLAVLNRQRQASHLARCLDNLGQVAKATLAFAADHDGTLPDTPPNPPGDLWWWYKEQVKSYAGLTAASSAEDRVFACPDDRGYSEPQPFYRSARFDFGSYVFNGVNLPGMPHIAGSRIDAVRTPARTLLVMEWTAHAPLSWHRSRTGRQNLPFYNDAESVLGFVDGHVRLSPVHYDGYTAAFTRDPPSRYEYQYSGH